MIRSRQLAGLGLSLSFLVLHAASAAQPTVRQALSLVPMQKDVPFDRPAEAQIDQCTIQPERQGDLRAWVVADADGNLLRRFSDTNGDNKIDQWCYFQGGVEIYRDIDGDYQRESGSISVVWHRWAPLGTGSRRRRPYRRLEVDFARRSHRRAGARRSAAKTWIALPPC